MEYINELVIDAKQIDNEIEINSSQINNDVVSNLDAVDNEIESNFNTIDNEFKMELTAESSTAYKKVSTLKNITMGDLKTMKLSDLYYVQN